MLRERSTALAVSYSLLQTVLSAHVVEAHLVIRLLRLLIIEDFTNLSLRTLVTIN